MKIYKSITELIGRTPLLEVTNIEMRINNLKRRVLVKLEYFNPAGSVKDRAALSMIRRGGGARDVSDRERLIIEPTSGNTGIGLAAVAASRGYKDSICHAGDHERGAQKTSGRLRRTDCTDRRKQRDERSHSQSGRAGGGK